MTLRWDCDKDGCYKNMLPDWGMLKGCFAGTSVMPADVDGQVEQNGCFLILEQKLPKGRLSAPAIRGRKLSVDRGDTHVTFWGRGYDVRAIEVHGLDGYTTEPMAASLQDLRQVCYDWWRKVYRDGKSGLQPTCPPPLRMDGHSTIPADVVVYR